MQNKGATKHCCYGLCKSDSCYPKTFPEGTEFIRFPKPRKITDSMTEWQKKQESAKTDKAKRWLHACDRKGQFDRVEQITKDTCICSLHFVGGKGPTDNNPDPYPARLSETEIAKRSVKRKAPKDRETIAVRKAKPKRIRFSPSTDKRECDGDQQRSPVELEICEQATTSGSNIMGEERSDSSKVDKETQTIYCKYYLNAKIESMFAKNDMSATVILKDRKKCKHFIGLYPSQFEALFRFLGEAKYNLLHWNSKAKSSNTESLTPSPRTKRPSEKLSIKEQLFITLLRPRRGFDIATIAYIYDVSETLICKIFTTWIQFLFCHFKQYKYQMFPCRQISRPLLPKIFKKFKNVRCSVNCTEFFCESPTDYGQQGNMYSSYKNHTTMKCLIAVNPNGAACFVSDLFEGSLSDVRIFKQCGILEHIIIIWRPWEPGSNPQPAATPRGPPLPQGGLLFPCTHPSRWYLGM